MTVLCVCPDQDERTRMETLFSHSRWTLYHATGIPSALSLLRQLEVGVVLCERDVPSGTWIDLLEPLKLWPDAPPLIVTSRLADERLWSEALNLGAYDVLARPFDLRELTRSVSLAWLHWRHRHDGAQRLAHARLAS